MAERFEQKDGRGMMWSNDRKRSDRDPGYTGNIKVDGKEFWISAWVEDDRARPGKKRLSLAVNPKDGGRSSSTTSRNDEPFPDDDIPF